MQLQTLISCFSITISQFWVTNLPRRKLALPYFFHSEQQQLKWWRETANIIYELLNN